MQINTGNGWLTLPVADEPKELDGEKAGFDVPYDPTIRGFSAALGIDQARGHALFRVNGDQGEGQPYWVDVGNVPMLLPGKTMTVRLVISPADLGDD
jgi:hypothetical protein